MQAITNNNARCPAQVSTAIEAMMECRGVAAPAITLSSGRRVYRRIRTRTSAITAAIARRTSTAFSRVRSNQAAVPAAVSAVVPAAEAAVVPAAEAAVVSAAKAAVFSAADLAALSAVDLAFALAAFPAATLAAALAAELAALRADSAAMPADLLATIRAAYPGAFETNPESTSPDEVVSPLGPLYALPARQYIPWAPYIRGLIALNDDTIPDDPDNPRQTPSYLRRPSAERGIDSINQDDDNVHQILIARSHLEIALLDIDSLDRNHGPFERGSMHAVRARASIHMALQSIEEGFMGLYNERQMGWELNDLEPVAGSEDFTEEYDPLVL